MFAIASYSKYLLYELRGKTLVTVQKPTPYNFEYFYKKVEQELQRLLKSLLVNLKK